MGDSAISDWPLEPVEMVHGVPFLITRGFWLGGLPEAPDWYLSYCETNCVWSSYRFRTETQQEMNEAFQSLLMSPKWKAPLNNDERAFLELQIQ